MAPKASTTPATRQKKAAVVKLPTETIQTIGRRKTSIARLRLSSPGSGAFIINNKKSEDYFRYGLWKEILILPLSMVGLDGKVDVSVKVNGGGLKSQVEAVRLALCRALIKYNLDWRPVIKKMGWLTRDPREKERKKPGLKRARRAPQWQKR